MTDLAKMEIKINFKAQLLQDGIAIAIAAMNMDSIAAMIVNMVMVITRN